MQHPYHTIHSFFDAYPLPAARSLLGKMITTAESGTSWKGPSPSQLLYFSEKMKELMKAAFSVTCFQDYRTEVILEKNNHDSIWSLNQYRHYCSAQANYTPWHFFPRYLNKKEFLDPYKALEKFALYQNLAKWKYVVKDILHHALSPVNISEFDDGISILHTFIHLNKLLEASHLIAIRIGEEPAYPNNLQWKNKKEEPGTEEQNSRR